MLISKIETAIPRHDPHKKTSIWHIIYIFQIFKWHLVEFRTKFKNKFFLKLVYIFYNFDK